MAELSTTVPAITAVLASPEACERVSALPGACAISPGEVAIVGDASFFDLNQLGKAGIIPGWPGDDVAPPQPMIQQTRAVLDRYAAAGGRVTEVELEGCGHSPHLERPEEFRAALVELVLEEDEAAA